MKPAAFKYFAPRSTGEALTILREHQDEAKVLAGGQSLVPAMNFRLARPSVIVDIAHLDDLEMIDASRPDEVRIGARVRHRDLERNNIPGPLGRLLSGTARLVGHYPIRVKGTFGGSLAHADPAAEWCALARALDATMHCRSLGGTRSIRANDFFDSMAFTTLLEPDELLEQISLPRLGDRTGVGVSEFARRWGDFAIVLAIAVVEFNDTCVARARIALGGVAGTPLRAVEAEAVLNNRHDRPLTATAINEAADVAAAEVDPISDIHGSGEYRRDLVRAMVRRALRQASQHGS